MRYLMPELARLLEDRRAVREKMLQRARTAIRIKRAASDRGADPRASPLAGLEGEGDVREHDSGPLS